MFVPLIKGERLGDVLNASTDGLKAALSSGKITYSKGVFSGRFDSKVSRDLRGLGAKWDLSDQVFRLPSDELPQDLKSAVALSESSFKMRMQSLSSKLDAVLEKSPWDRLNVGTIIKTSVFKMDSSFRANVQGISVQPEVSDRQASEIARLWEDGLKRKMKDATTHEMQELREKIKKSYFSGDRYGTLTKSIETAFSVSTRKAEFIARQETSLLTAAYQGGKYVESGFPYYLWRCVPGTPAHPTRHRHEQLSAMSDRGILFRWDDPPVSTGPRQAARNNNPGEDFNCRCRAIPVYVSAVSKVVKVPEHGYKVLAA